MKLVKLKILQKELESEFLPEGIESHIFYYHAEKWNDLQNSHMPATTISNLEKSTQEEVSHHSSNSHFAWFHIHDIKITIRLKFKKTPQKQTRQRYREKIIKIRETAHNAYRVSHHSLTHLLAKDSFRDHLIAAINSINSESTSTPETQDSELPKTLGVLALDIDHFKQINDTWGHLYGDQVLKTFGMRLEACANQIIARDTGSPEIHIGHPSGEEFLILILAHAAKEQFIGWANEFRAKISDEILPLESEWTLLSKSEDLSAITPPPIPDRRVSTSIGLVLHSSISTSESAADLTSTLLDRADTALYRAKAAGRNQVIIYDDILSSCGRVLEQDVNTGIVVIDIGSNVGVTIGQEFKVFSPTFTGKKSFQINDGRTTRTLGFYPRVESSRIVAFNVQPEISFAFVPSPEDALQKIEIGSHLEAIPAGSIGHLLPNASRYFPPSNETANSGGLQALQEFIQQQADTNKSPFAVVIRFSRESEYIKKFGTAALNIALAKLYRAAQGKFHTTQKVEVLDRGSICITGPNSSYNQENISNFIDEIADEFPELGIIAGSFNEEDRNAIIEEQKIILNPVNCLEFARFSASERGRRDAKRTRSFRHNTATSVLQSLRESRSYETAYTDFKTLLSLGLTTSTILNLGGLISDSLGNAKEALSHYEAAYRKDPDNLIIKGNFCITAYQLGNLEGALHSFKTIPNTKISDLKTKHQYAYVVYAAALAKARLSKLELFDQRRFTLIAKSALKIAESMNYTHSANSIRSALSLSP